MEYFPIQKVWFNWKGEPSALAIQLKAKGDPLKRKKHQFFSQRTPARAIQARAEE